MSGIKRIFNWVEVIAWSALIFSFSGESFTTSRTLIALQFWVTLLNLPVDPATLELVHAVARKGAHFGEFFIFGLILFRALSDFSRRNYVRHAVWVLVIGVFLAVADEVRQGWARDRTPSLYDSAVDSAGVLASQLWIVSRARWRHRRKGTGADPPGEM